MMFYRLCSVPFPVHALPILSPIPSGCQQWVRRMESYKRKSYFTRLTCSDSAEGKVIFTCSNSCAIHDICQDSVIKTDFIFNLTSFMGRNLWEYNLRHISITSLFKTVHFLYHLSCSRSSHIVMV